MAGRILEAVAALNQAIIKKNDSVSIIDHDYPGERLRTEDYDRRKRRMSAVNAEFDKAWISALKGLDELCKAVRQRQPHLSQLTGENINMDGRFPTALAFGRLRLTYLNWSGFVPRLLPFPVKRSLWLPNDGASHRMLHQLLLRLIHVLPVGKLEITVADPLRLGKSLAPFRSLLDTQKLFPDRRALTRADEIEAALAQLTDYVENLLQNRFRDETTSWAAYNSNHRDSPLPYKVLLLFGVPEQLTDKSVWYLGRLLEHGPLCGVLPVLTIDRSRLEDRKFAGLHAVMEQHSRQMDAMVPADFMAQRIPEIAVGEQEESWPEPQALAAFFTSLSDRYQRDATFQKSLTDLWGEADYFAKDATHGLVAPIGWTAEGDPVPFSLGCVTSEHHALLAGRSGSGKSNLLHVLIHSLCHVYSPAELNIYLLDYKQGTEFHVYAKPPLPQARLVATESDPEYGVTVLAHLTEELERRSCDFKNQSVRDFYEYRETASAGLPRILLIIDEFQVLFSESRQLAECAEKMLTQLLRQGRAFGIHVLLATQTLKGIQSLSMGQLISQIGCRIALACSEEDSAMILGSNNWEAAKLKSPPQGIVNDANGAKSANQTFLIPFADRDLTARHITGMAQAAHRHGHIGATRVFNGARLPALPDAAWFASRREEGVRLLLGESLSYSSDLISVPLVQRPSTNVLVSGYSDVIHDGLLAAILQSLESSAAIDEVIYLNSRGVVPREGSGRRDRICKTRFRSCDTLADLDLAELADELKTVRRVLIVDGLDSAKELHAGLAGFKPLKKDEPPAPQESFKKILEDGPAAGTFVIAFADNWKRCNSACKDHLAFFELRVGFCMNEDDAGSFVSGAIGKLKGLEPDNRAVFADRLKNKVVWFRPFVSGETI
ncbi:FtsK/SpoIIIE domain-containing protein [Geomonas paludis]|uniref:FtsK/SpoIIIE domain-containing protein n=1 Tax=Geomonas paludis TaxID=2740185 RepID=A0ABY4LJ05_9BACT|nr:FtsK/SpoIIIE domain-containing protein [Geomonas paludis]UPU37500.1 FtsK/SpoIIIE domain-containing protein [Geomonas paludis]